MLDSFEKQILQNYLSNFFAVSEIPKKAFAAVCSWLEDHFTTISEKEPCEDFFDLLSQFQSAAKRHSNTRLSQKHISEEMSTMLTSEAKHREPSAGYVEHNLRLLGTELKLDEIDRKIFGFITRYKLNSLIEDLADNLSREGMPVHVTLALLTGLDRKLISERLSPSQTLISSGLIQLKYYKGNDVTDRYDLPDSIAEALQKESCNLNDIRTHILGCPVSAKLEWDDFSHLDDIRKRLACFLTESIKNNVEGINVLLWGPPGTGKTEFCKTLAKEIKYNLYAVGETDEDGNEPSRSERLNALRLAQSLLRYRNHSFLMLDEMDDLFEGSSIAQIFGGKFKAPSKIFMNRLLENNPTPTIWIVNEARYLDETIIRRMSLVLEIQKPPHKSRKEVWKRIVDARQLDLPEKEINELVNLDISPAILDSAAKFAQVTGQGHEDILFASRGFINAIQGKQKPKHRVSSLYCPDLLNTDMNLADLGSKLLKSEQKDFSLCLYGLPGTGKTEYVRQLAKQLNMSVLVKKTSDLMSPYVGENEQNIAAAFQEAQDNERFLVFDEADSLLGDRRHAVRSWEISLVNEMLAWMESHPLPFACTTNLMERLDQASLRRFTFKVSFSQLTVEQNRLAFKRFFDSQSPKKLDSLKGLTPGDYAVVRKKAGILGLLKQPNELVDMLQVESSAKENTNKHIGFAAQFESN